MDEAEYLGDRIGIMDMGKLINCGSPLFLRNKHGTGIHIEIEKERQNEDMAYL